ncbi:hypothetical protein PR048_021949 [Dryococelus australis]|uniref:Uncharacterized protein n=1 Tax=Dryococelus australis TaxID=614101 RepID=A0ABQ9GZM9_9NEOP|nr:hypothetical protein PR048_021949 [Dryococelus australis]
MNNVGKQPVPLHGRCKYFCFLFEHMSTFGYPVTTSDSVAVIVYYLNKIGRKVSRFMDDVYSGPHWANVFFGRQKALLRVANVPKTHIFNFGKTNITDDPGQSKMVTTCGNKYQHKIVNSSKFSVTLMFCGGVQLEKFSHPMKCINILNYGPLGAREVQLIPNIIPLRLDGSLEQPLPLRSGIWWSVIFANCLAKKR